MHTFKRSNIMLYLQDEDNRLIQSHLKRLLISKNVDLRLYSVAKNIYSYCAQQSLLDL